MADPLEIKNKEPSISKMLADYRLVFAQPNLKLILFWCGVVALLIVGWFITPSAVDDRANIILRVLAFFDAFFLFGFGGFLVLSLLAPLLARIVLPLVITLLEIVRLLVLFVQYLVDELLIHSLINSFLYPISTDEASPDA
jgi:hypothetical protein